MHLTLLLSEQCSAASATMALELLTAANLFSGQPIFQIITASLDGGRAKHLLESTRMNLDSITFKVGYQDSNSFRRLFQQRVGMQPASYRKKFQTQAV